MGVTVMDVGVMLGAHTTVIAVILSGVIVILVMVSVVETPVLAGVMMPVLIMVIAALMFGICVPTIKENKPTEKLLKNLPKLPELTDKLIKEGDKIQFIL